MDRGDIYHVDLNPTKGREQQGARYVLILSPKAYNKITPPLVCPITQGGDYARYYGFTVSLMGVGTSTQGVALCNQIRTLDLSARPSQFIEKVPDYIIDDVLEKIKTILE